MAPKARPKTAITRGPAEVAPTPPPGLLPGPEARRRGAPVGAFGDPRRPNTVIAVGARRVPGRARDTRAGGDGANGEPPLAPVTRRARGAANLVTAVRRVAPKVTTRR